MATTDSSAPDAHYDAVTRAWRCLLGEHLHYGYFVSEDDTLPLATQRLIEVMAQSAGLDRASGRVVDIGCGTGGPARFLARRYGCRVSGLSTSPVGIDLAKELALEQGLEKELEFHVADATSTGLPDAAFDYAWVMESSHLMPDKPAVIAESARQLRVGGTLALCDIIVHNELPIQEVLMRARAFDLLRRVYGRAKMAPLVAYETWCAEHGLVDVEVRDISAETRPTFAAWEANAKAHRDLVVGLIGVDGHRDFVDSCAVLRKFWDEGVLGYGMVTARKRSGGWSQL